MNIKLIKSDDWESLKIDGNLYYENHRIDSDVWLKLLEDNFNVKVQTEIINEED